MWTNPAEHASPPIAVQREIHSPPVDAVVRLLAATGDAEPARLLLPRSVVWGERGPLCGLRWSDLDLIRESVAFCRSIAEGPDGPVVVPTKNRRRHRVEIDDTTIAG